MRKVYVKNKKEKDDIDSVDFLMGCITVAGFFIVLCIFWALTVNAPKTRRVSMEHVDAVSMAAPIVKVKKQWVTPQKHDNYKPRTYIDAISKSKGIIVSDIPKIKVTKEKPLKITVRR